MKQEFRPINWKFQIAKTKRDLFFGLAHDDGSESVSVGETYSDCVFAKYFKDFV